jgi:hypothetical protein
MNRLIMDSSGSAPFLVKDQGRFRVSPVALGVLYRVLSLMGLKVASQQFLIRWTVRKFESLLNRNGSLFTATYFKALFQRAAGRVPPIRETVRIRRKPFHSRVRGLIREKRREVLTVLRMFRKLTSQLNFDYESIIAESTQKDEDMVWVKRNFSSSLKTLIPKSKDSVLFPEHQLIARRVWRSRMSYHERDKRASRLDAQKFRYSHRKDEEFGRKSKPSGKYLKGKGTTVSKSEVVNTLVPMMYSTKVGPNGPAIYSMDLDMTALTADQSLMRSVSSLWDYFGLHFETAKRTFGKTNGSSRCVHSRLEAIPDAACKTRVVAIGDYFTQVGLSMIHHRVMKLLRDLSFDGTHSHRKAVRRLRMKRRNSFFDSIDLSTATDRFPIWLQTLTVERLYPGLGRVWESVMSDRDFQTPSGPIRYAVGQPMGFLSSWPVFALTHHCLAHSCAIASGFTRARHIIVGDDIVLYCQKTSELYRKALKALGVGFKNVKFTKKNSFNFCERYILGGEDVSPVSWESGSDNIVIAMDAWKTEGINPSLAQIGRLHWQQRNWKMILRNPSNGIYPSKWKVSEASFVSLRRKFWCESIWKWTRSLTNSRISGPPPNNLEGTWFATNYLNRQREAIRLIKDVRARRSPKLTNDEIRKLKPKTLPYDLLISEKWGEVKKNRSHIMWNWLVSCQG